ncbi:MerR family transcriptional regulator [Cytobacillus purgationiresistens]|uniref:DNA-binding transcriptional MerR regulator n=1 Tax=Cytobacillus purgationiresistens TaxID=863449 RepID=A0ABU0AN70_9BACI|nr:MerR family transcriptional regulator [Cytobacillus purgationiresistens]MDQ0272724.1 DNA-binding transcriptional MerR regulator [Cytobacillus purgationiresistens]
MGETIGEFAKRMNVTVRTLRYYDEIGLLQPQNVNEQGHKVYESQEVNILQRIQAWKFLGIPLEEIKPLIEESTNNLSATLSHQKNLLIQQRKRLNAMIEAVEDTEQIMTHSKDQSAESIDILYIALNMYRMEEEQEKFFQAHLPEELTTKLFHRSEEERGKLIAQNTRYLHHMLQAMKNGTDPASDEVQMILTEVLKNSQNFTDPEIVKKIADNIELFEANEHLFTSMLPQALKEYSDSAMQYYYLNQ